MVRGPRPRRCGARSQLLRAAVGPVRYCRPCGRDGHGSKSSPIYSACESWARGPRSDAIPAERSLRRPSRRIAACSGGERVGTALRRSPALPCAQYCFSRLHAEEPKRSRGQCLDANAQSVFVNHEARVVMRERPVSASTDKEKAGWRDA